MPDAYYSLGNMYFEGKGTAKNYKEAVKWFEKAAEQGEPDSIFHLGICYAEGLGVDKNINKAIDYFFKAADLGWRPALEVIRQNNLKRFPSNPF